MLTTYRITGRNNQSFRWPRDFSEIVAAWPVNTWRQVRMQFKAAGATEPALEFVLDPGDRTAGAAEGLFSIDNQNVAWFDAPASAVAEIVGAYAGDCRLELASGAIVDLFAVKAQMDVGPTTASGDPASTSIAGAGVTVQTFGEADSSPVPLPVSLATAMRVAQDAATAATEKAGDAAGSADLAQRWATDMGAEVQTGAGYSAKQYATNAAGSAGAAAQSLADQNAANSAATATINGIKTQAQDARDLAQKWATQTGAEVVVGQGYGAKYYQLAAVDAASLAAQWATSLSVVAGGQYGALKYANDASTSAGLAQQWAVSLSVVSGGQYGALKYATDAATSATAAANSATAAAGSASSALGSATSASNSYASTQSLYNSVSSLAISASMAAASAAAASNQAVLVAAQRAIALMTDGVDGKVIDWTRVSSDGGAWLSKTGSLSYSNETLNTAYAGARQDTPAIMTAIAGSANGLQLNDGGDVTSPMWRRFAGDGTATKFPTQAIASTTSMDAAEGLIVFSTAAYTWFIDLATDQMGGVYGNQAVAASGNFKGSISQRNATQGFDGLQFPFGFTGTASTGTTVYDVAVGVRSTSPVDPARLGLRKPIAVRFDSGGMVVFDFETKQVYASAETTAFKGGCIRDGKIWSHDGTSYFCCDIPTATGFRAKAVTFANSGGDVATLAGTIPTGYCEPDAMVRTSTNVSSMSTPGCVTFTKRPTLSQNAIPGLDARNTLTADLTTSYLTGWKGRGCILSLAESSADLANLAAATDFASGYNAPSASSPWVLGMGASLSGSTVTFGGQYGNCVLQFGASSLPTLTPFAVYRVEASVQWVSGNTNLVLLTENAVGTLQVPITVTSTPTVFKTYMIAPPDGKANIGIQDRNASGFGSVNFTDLKVIKVGADRSGAATHMTPVGYVSRSVVATGADMAGYTNLNWNAYLSYDDTTTQKFNFGKGDFALAQRVRLASTPQSCIMSYGTGAAGSGWEFLVLDGGRFRFRWCVGGVQSAVYDFGSPGLFDGRDHDVVLQRKNGIATLFFDGTPFARLGMTQDLTVAGGSLYLGYAGGSGLNLTNGFAVGTNPMLSQVRIYNTAPFADDDIKGIVADENPLFQQNAKFLLPSMNCQSVARDPEYRRILIGTDAGTAIYAGFVQQAVQKSTTGTNLFPGSALPSAFTYSHASLGSKVAGVSSWGGGEAWALIDDTSASNHNWTKSYTAPGTAITVLVPVQAAAQAGCFVNATVGINAAFNLSTGAVVSSSGTTGQSTASMGSGWYLCAVNATPAAGAQSVYLQAATSAGVYGYAGAGTAAINFGKPMIVAGTYTATQALALYADGLSQSDNHKFVAAGAGQYLIGTANGFDWFAPAVNQREGLSRRASQTWFTSTTAIDKLLARLGAIFGATDVTGLKIYTPQDDVTLPGAPDYRDCLAHTSLEREALGVPGVRGPSQKLPKALLLVTRSTAANAVQAYDLGDPDVPLHANFVGTNSIAAGTGNALMYVTSVATTIKAMNGLIAIVGGSSGVALIDLIADTADVVTSAGRYRYNGNLAQRNDKLGATQISTAGIVSNGTNDVDLAVLPLTQPNPLRLGLPNPTAAVGTVGGTSLIRADGIVCNSSNTSPIIAVAFDRSGGLWSSITSSWVGYTPASSLLASSWATPTIWTVAQMGVGNVKALRAIGPNKVMVAGATGLATIYNDPNNPAGSLISVKTATYETGFMPGAQGGIKCALAESIADLSSLVAATIASDDFSSYANTGALAAVWLPNGTPGGTDTTYALAGSGASGAMAITRGAGGVAGCPYLTVSGLTVGKAYVLQLSISGASAAIYPVDGAGGTGATIGFSIATYGVGIASIPFIATATTAKIGIWPSASTTTTVDNFSIKLAATDRSAAGNHAVINGTITRSAVASGADLAMYSGFSASNFLEIPYSSAFDYGTADCLLYAGWLLNSGNGLVCNRGYYTAGAYSGSLYELYVASSTTLTLNLSGYSLAQATVPAGLAFVVALIRGGYIELYVNGQRAARVTSGGWSATNTSATIKMGCDPNGARGAFPGSVALARFGSVAPTPDQIAAIYADEVRMFQPGAKILLPSATVQALGFDRWTNRAIVGTAGGTAIMSGLQVVDTRTALSSWQLSNDNIKAVDGFAGHIGIASAQECVVEFPSVALRESLVSRRPAPQFHDPTWAVLGPHKTTNATPLNIPFGCPVREGESFSFEITVSGIQRDTQVASCEYTIAGKAVWPLGGTFRVDSATPILEHRSSASLSVGAVTADTTNKLPQVPVTGLASTDMIWTIKTRWTNNLLQTAAYT